MRVEYMGAPQLAEWMNQHPAERLAKCVIGKRDRGSPRCFESLNHDRCGF
jgi:hypothetical protein